MRLGYTPFNAGVLDLAGAFRLAGELGLDFLELSWDLQEIEPRTQPAPAVRELTRATGIGVTLHLPFVDMNLAALSPGVRENSVARTRRGLEYGAEVGALVGVLHTGLVPLRHPLVLERARPALEASLAELAPLIPIALENLALTHHDLLRGPAELEAATPHGFGQTLDFGHATVEGATLEHSEGAGPGGLDGGAARLRSYQAGLSRITHLHLHDNDGSGDQHRPLGQGCIDWGASRDFLRGFAGTATLEVGGGLEGVRLSVAYLRELLG